MGNKHVKTFFISKTVVKLLIFYVEVMNSHVVQIDFPAVSRKRTNFNVLYCVFEYYMHLTVTFSHEHFI